MADFDVGDVARLTATFRAVDGTPTNTTVVLTVRKPDGTSSTPSATNTGAGVYEANVVIDQPGVWDYSFAGSGAVGAREGGRLYVRRDPTL
jgi:hypothetical protein